MTTPNNSSSMEELREHNTYDSELTKILMREHPERDMETTREAALVCSNTMIKLMSSQLPTDLRKQLYKKLDRYARKIAVSGINIGYNTTAQEYVSQLLNELEVAITHHTQQSNKELIAKLLENQHELLSAAYTTENGYVQVDATAGHPAEVKAVPVSEIERITKEILGEKES